MDLFKEIERYGDLRANEIVEGEQGSLADADAARASADSLLAEIRAEYEHNGRPPMQVDLVQRMQTLITHLAKFDLAGRRGADELDLIWNEAASVALAIEAWYEGTVPDGGAS